MSLSERVRPGSEAAPWVVEEIKKLEADIKHLKAGLEHCATIFTAYGEIHQRKNSAEARQKWETNRAHAQQCRDLIEKIES